MRRFEVVYDSLCSLRDEYFAKSSAELDDSLSEFYLGRAGAYAVACLALKEAIDYEKKSQ
jgi:hypothetical protein